ncbi:MAG: hypothetical protein BWZ02_02797 [Lentisphaerae bacterium ADurb.BinA184]|nr:MAG: hypothetical protein BWZ02_02797 [Lentisphaerae bacterium ADurb.BinA184]
MTLTEVVVTSGLAAIVLAGVMAGLVASSDAMSLATQRTAALGLCQEKLESIRSDAFANVVQESYPEETGLSLTHTEANPQYVFPCTRQVTVADITSGGVAARRITVVVSWRFRDSERSETLHAIVYDMS